MKLEGKTIVVTGGTSGIGYQLVNLLHRKNAVCVIARSGPRLEAVGREFEGVRVYPCDLSEPSNFSELTKRLLDDYGHVDVLVNNAAKQNTPMFIDTEFEYSEIEREVNLNFTAVCSLCYLLLPGLMHTGQPSAIVNVNSGLALAPKTSSAVYCATKAAMDSFSQSLGYQLESTQVQVFQAFLPLVDTAMTHGRGSGKLSPEYAAKKIVDGLERDQVCHDIGKVKLLRLLRALAPKGAKKIMKKA